jgi:hypothetical protein
VTCRDRVDGAGAQVTAALSTLLYAKHFGYSYVHSPLTNVAHFPPEAGAAEWASKWEEFFSVGANEVPASNLSQLKEVPLPRPHRWRPKRGRLNVVHHCHKVTDKHPELWHEFRPEVRRRYHLTPKPAHTLTNPEVRRIAVHIRRGDVMSDNQFAERFTPNERIVSILSRTIEALGEEACEVHIYSQSGSDFSGFDTFDPVWHLDDDAFTSFHALASCDILLAATSSFSWLAGLVNDGHVIQDTFWHPAMPDWLSFGDMEKLSLPTLAAHLRPRKSQLSRGHGHPTKP